MLAACCWQPAQPWRLPLQLWMSLPLQPRALPPRQWCPHLQQQLLLQRLLLPLPLLPPFPSTPFTPMPLPAPF